MAHPSLPNDLKALIEQKTEGEGRKAKLSLIIKQVLQEAQVSRLKEAYGNNEKVNKAIDKVLKKMNDADVKEDADESEDSNGE